MVGVGITPPKVLGTPKLERYLPAYLDRSQADKLFAMAQTRAWEGRFEDVRNLAILELFYSTGMRLSELQGHSRQDVDLVSQQVKVNALRELQSACEEDIVRAFHWE